MLKFILILIGIYILYKFVFQFLIPVAGVARQMNRKMEEFRRQQQEMFQQQQAAANPSPQPNPKGVSGDYIDFEEVK